MTATAVYMLQPILDDPRYEGFASDARSSSGDDSLVADFMPESDERGARPRRLAADWRPPKVEGRARSFNDYPCINMLIPAFSQRAVDALGDFLKPNGELLPVISDVGDYFAYNLRSMADVLNVKASDALWFPDSHEATWIKRYAFFPKKVEDLTIFKIPEDPASVYVTDTFVNRARERHLEGFDFIKVWPLPEGAQWKTLHKREKAKREREGLKQGRRIKGESVFIRLPLKAKKPTKAEEKQLDQITDELDEMLVERKSKAPPIGSAEGYECENGVCTIALSCPDSAVLIKTLRPWLRSLKWDGGDVKVLERDAEYDNVEANEQIVDLRR